MPGNQININKNLFGWFADTKANIEALTDIPIPSIGFGWDTAPNVDGEFGTYNGVSWKWGTGTRLFKSTDFPSSTDDETLGYIVGDWWLRTITDDLFRCADATEGAAVWSPMAKSDHGSLNGLGDDDHPQYVNHGLAVTTNDFLVSNALGWVRKTLAETITILRTSLDSIYAAIGHTHTAAQEILTANRTYYVRTDGNDSNDGLTNSSGGAFLTVQKAVDTVAALNINGQTVTIQLADGTYSGAITLKNVVGHSVGGDLIINGNDTTPANVVISAATNAITANGISTVWRITNLRITTTGGSGSCLFSVAGANIQFGGIHFHTSAYAHIRSVGGKIQRIGNYWISGSPTTGHISAESGADILIQSGTCTLLANITVSAFAAASVASTLLLNSMTWTLGAFSVTGSKYNASLNAVIYSAATLPGSTAGTTPTGGQYV